MIPTPHPAPATAQVACARMGEIKVADNAVVQLVASAVPGPAGVVALVVVAFGTAMRVATPSLLAWISVVGPRDMRARALKALSVIKSSKGDE